jgi:acyl-CoA thioesterase-1
MTASLPSRYLGSEPAPRLGYSPFPMRVCFFGDSLINGTGDDDALGWAGRIVARARQGGRDVTLYNLGIRRDTSGDIAARWKREATVRISPECDGRLVFSFGVNDCASSGADHAPRVEHAQSVANAELILEAAQRWLPTLMVGPAILADDPQANARVAALSADYARLCGRLGIPYLEICHLVATSPVWGREALAADGAHPNRGGYTLLADAIAEWEAWRRWTYPLP